MHGTNSGFVAGGHASADDGFLRLDFRFADNTDLGQMLGASPAPNRRHLEVRNAVIIACVLAAWEHGDQWLAYPRDRSRFATLRRYFGNLWSYNALMWAIDTLLSEDLIEEQRTRPTPAAKQASSKVQCSRMRATLALLERLPTISTAQLDLFPGELIRLKRSRKLVDYRETDHVRWLRCDVIDQNEALQTLNIEIRSPRWRLTRHGFLTNDKRTLNPLRSHCYRVFNEEWHFGGRIFGPFWQNLSVEDRARLTINGAPVVELDYQHIHPTLLAAYAGIELGEEDPYLIARFARRDTKQAFNILINAKTMRAAVGALQNYFVKQKRREPGKHAKRVIAAIKQYHPAFEHTWGAGIGLQLQAVDAHICAHVQRAMRALGHPVLSVHNSFIAPATKELLLDDVMQDVLERAKHQLAKGDTNVLLNLLK